MNENTAPRLLFSSLSSKIALYSSVLKQAKMFLPKASVVGADCDPCCPGATSVKYFSVLPKLDDLSNNQLIAFLSKAGITHILPTRDGELQYWASMTDFLLDYKVEVFVSSLGAIKICEDKLLFPKKISAAELKIIPSFSSPDESEYEKWVVKERYGSGSKGLSIAVDKIKAQEFGASLTQPIFQPFISGKEFTAEGWISKNGECMAVLLRWREKVVNGESFVSTTFENSDWEKRIKKLFNSIQGLKGHCLGQFIVDGDGNLNLVEINPRFGGASPLSLSSGLNSILWSLSEDVNEQFFEPEFQPLHGVRLTKLNGQVFISYPN